MYPQKHDLHLVVVAGGSGSRMNSQVPKQFLDIRPGRTIFEETLIRLCNAAVYRSIVITLPLDWLKDGSRLASAVIPGGTDLMVVPGGGTRQESSAIGVACLEGMPDDIVLIHDAARPFVSTGLIDRLIRAVCSVGVAIPVIGSQDSLIRVSDGLISDYLNRDEIRRVQTPQAFRLQLIRDAHREAIDGLFGNACDDATLTCRIGYPAAAIEGDPENLKITTPADLEVARMKVLEESSRV